MLAASDLPGNSRASDHAIFLGIRVATMSSDGNLFLLEHAVAPARSMQTGSRPQEPTALTRQRC
jgi:hypothetical protein